MAHIKHFGQMMKDDATGLVANFIGDYSDSTGSGLITASVGPSAGHILAVKSMVIMIEDDANPDSGYYGGINAALPVGITFKVVDDTGTLVDMTNGNSIKTNGDFGRMAEKVEAITFGAGNTFVKVTHNFARASYPLVLFDKEGGKFQISLNDNFSGLVSHTVYVGGMEVEDNIKNRKILSGLRVSF